MHPIGCIKKQEYMNKRSYIKENIMTRKQKKMLIRILLSTVLLIGFSILFSVIKSDLIWLPYLKFIAFMVPYFIVGYDILKKAFKGILNKQVFDENFLMAIATVGAIVIAILDNSSYTEAIAVMLFYQVGELFQSYAVGKSRRNISDLMDIRPDYANLEKDGTITTVDPYEVEIGSIIVVSAGEKIPIDSIVVEGTTTLDTSALTGESVPRKVSVGDEVISGSVNLTGTIRVRTVKKFEESTVSKILDLVENSSSKKSKSEKFISKFARVYTPAVCYGALALAVVPPIARLIFGYDSLWFDWIYRALTFLVISCPCALVISIPLTFFAGIGGASKEGVLVKGSNYLEALSKTKIVAFDKTGTMTKGVFEVSEIVSNNISKEELLEKAAYCECFSSHPISKSLQNAYAKEINKKQVSDVKELAGLGLTAKVQNDTVAVGNSKLMSDIGVKCFDCNKNGTVVHIAINNEYAGYILISDSLKPTSKQAVSNLKKAGVSKTVMLTGDTKSVAQFTANELNIDDVYSELLPADKVEKVEMLLDKKGKNETLAFVGDGINDAPVLSRADVGIAMGALGSDAAIEAADVVLMDDDPVKISKAIKISRKCMHIVYENIYFAIGVKLVCLILGALGIANMWLAIFADVGVMVIAVINAIRALNVKKL